MSWRVKAVAGFATVAAVAAIAWMHHSPPVRPILDARGQGIGNTRQFTVTIDTWSVEVSFKCQDTTAGMDAYVATERDQAVDLIQLPPAGAASKTATEYDPGTYFIRVNSACPWRVVVRAS